MFYYPLITLLLSKRLSLFLYLFFFVQNIACQTAIADTIVGYKKIYSNNLS